MVKAVDEARPSGLSIPRDAAVTDLCGMDDDPSQPTEDHAKRDADMAATREKERVARAAAPPTIVLNPGGDACLTGCPMEGRLSRHGSWPVNLHRRASHRYRQVVQRGEAAAEQLARACYELARGLTTLRRSLYADPAALREAMTGV
jgi:hypothetical protein